MLASQLIYTGCGKDRSGAFSVWSKSSDITKPEENEIREKMLYKRPTDLPFAPTQEELDTLFPKMFGYFNLSTGRVCMAQATYIGAVYSDLDKRTGNYIIHAFVFDKNEEIIPMNFIGNGMFKQFLTYEEWHDNDAPESLPQLEINERPGSLTKAEMDSFFDAGRFEQLKKLLQATLNAAKAEQKVTFYDDHKNLSYWYKAISICLPSYMQKELTFNTFFSMGMSYAMPGAGNGSTVNTEIMIRNISNSLPVSVFSYQQEANSGKYAFDLVNGIAPAMPEISHYVQAVVDTLRTNVFGAIKLVSEVSAIGDRCGVDLDRALDIHYLLEKQIAKIDDPGYINRLLEHVKDNYPERLGMLADCLYEYGLKSRRWRINAEVAAIYRFVFTNSAVADKNGMIELYIANQNEFGVPANLSDADYCKAFRKNAPFAWKEFLAYLLNDETRACYFKANGTSFTSHYLVFSSFVDASTEIARNLEHKRVMMQFFKDEMLRYLKEDTLQEALKLLDCIESLGAEWRKSLLEKTLEDLRKGDKQLSEVFKPPFVLRLAESCGVRSTAESLVLELISENAADDRFIKLYADHYDRNPSFYADIAKILKSDPKYAAFGKNMALYRFTNSDQVTRSQLQEYYDEYVLPGQDKGLFQKKLRQYLAAAPDGKIIADCQNAYRDWVKSGKLDRDLDGACTEIICKNFFTVPESTLKKYLDAEGFEFTDTLLKRLAESSNYAAPDYYYVYKFGYRLRSQYVEDAKSGSIKDILERLAAGQFYAFPKREESLGLFVKLYMGDVCALYIALRKEQDKDVEFLFRDVFKPISNCSGFMPAFRETLDKISKPAHQDRLLNDAVITACYCKDESFVHTLKSLVDKLLGDMSRGERKKYFIQLEDTVPKEYESKTLDFVDAYNKAHESFFDKLFGSFKKNDKNDKDDKDGKDGKGDKKAKGDKADKGGKRDKDPDDEPRSRSAKREEAPARYDRDEDAPRSRSRREDRDDRDSDVAYAGKPQKRAQNDDDEDDRKKSDKR